jgi:hypothetical protein
LTIGTPDANGRVARTVASLRMHVVTGNPATSADEADVQLQLDINDVHFADFDPADPQGEMDLVMSLRITDRGNEPRGADQGSGTVEDLTLRQPVYCYPTPDPDVGSGCGIDSSMDAMVPGTVKEGSRAVWEVGQLQIYEGDHFNGADELFMVQGLFVP